MFGDRLRLARRRAGLSLRDLSERIDPKVSAAAISKYESGAMLPSSSVLVALAGALGVSLDFLMNGQVVELAGVDFRKHSGTSAGERARAEAAVIDQVERYLAIDAILELDSDKIELPKARKAVASFEEAEELANKLRQDWKLGNDPIPSVTGLLEDKGVKVVASPLPKNVSGLSCAVKRNNQASVPVIVVSTHFSVERRRFTLAHELAHKIIGEASGDLSLERAINRFAAAFLMPADHLRKEVEGARDVVPPYSEIVRLKHLYGVAAAAVLMRLKDVRVVSEGTVSYAFQTYARPWRITEPDPLDPKGDCGRLEEPKRFERLVYWALADQLISLPRAAELLRQPIRDVELAMKGPAVGEAHYRQ